MRKRILTEDDYSKLTTKQALEEYQFEQSNLLDKMQRKAETDLEEFSITLNDALADLIRQNSMILEDMEKQYAKKSDIPDLTPYATNDEVEDLYNGLKTEIEELKKLIK